MDRTKTTSHAAEFGVVVPQRGGTSWASIASFANRAEELGFDTVWLVDHLLGFPPEAEIFESWTLACALSSITSRVRIGLLVACQSFRSPTLLAKMASTFRAIAGDRLRLLLGAGWHELEYSAYGYQFPDGPTRVEQLSEALQIVKGVCNSEPPVTFAGRHYSCKDLVNVPRLETALEVGIGGHGVRLVSVAAEFADEWNCPAAALPKVGQLTSLLEAKAHQFERSVRQSVQIVAHPDTDFPSEYQFYNPDCGLIGSPDQMAERVGYLAKLGVTSFACIVNNERTLETVGASLEVLRSAARATA